MTQKWYQKATVQSAVIAAIITGVLLFAAQLIPTVLQVPKLRDENRNLEQKLQEKTGEVQRLEILLAPFRTIALERFTGTETEALSKLALKIRDIESSLTALRDYSDVANLNLMGKPYHSSLYIDITTPISKMLDGAITYNENSSQYSIKCNPESEEKYKNIIRTFPKFPFSYSSLAGCLHQKGDNTWKDYSIQALDILDETTKIGGHHADHDSVQSTLSKLLNEASQR